MTDRLSWFRRQLRASGDSLVWAFEQISVEYQYRLPPAPAYLGDWSPARHMWHVTEYERCVAIPVMQSWLTDNHSDPASWQVDETNWESVQRGRPEKLIANFYTVRQAQINLLGELAEIDWDRQQQTPWGRKPLSMVVTKTFQHTYEHGDILLRMGLWWEDIERELAGEKIRFRG